VISGDFKTKQTRCYSTLFQLVTCLLALVGYDTGVWNMNAGLAWIGRTARLGFGRGVRIWRLLICYLSESSASDWLHG
jgi:hypothetical protein